MWVSHICIILCKTSQLLLPLQNNNDHNDGYSRGLTDTTWTACTKWDFMWKMQWSPIFTAPVSEPYRGPGLSFFDESVSEWSGHKCSPKSSLSGMFVYLVLLCGCQWYNHPGYLCDFLLIPILDRFSFFWLLPLCNVSRTLATLGPSLF